MAIDALGSDGLAAALRSVQMRGGATPIVPLRGNPYQPFAGTYEGGPRQALPQHTPGVGQGGGGSGGGASGAGAGLEKLGAGIAQGMKGFAAKRAQQQQFNDMLGGLPGRSTFGGPATSSATPAGGASPSPSAGSPLAAPYTPSPIGEASGLPSFAHGDEPGAMGTSIGPAGASLPTFAQGSGASSVAGNGVGFVPQFLTGIKAGEGTPYSGFSPTGAIGAYGLTGDFIKQYAPGAGLPTDRQSYFGNSDLQDKLATYAASKMYEKYGSWPAVANAWLTGSPMATTSAPGNMTPAAYDAKVMRAANAAPAGVPPTISQSGAAAYVANLPSMVGQSPQLAGPVPTSDTTGGQPVITGQGDPHSPGFDEGAVKFHDYHPEFSPGLTPAPAPSPPDIGPQGMLQPSTNDYQSMLALALMQNNQPDFNLGSSFGGGFFG